MKKIAIIASIFLIALVVFSLIKFMNFYRAIYTPTISTTPTPEKNAFNVLILGYGGGKHDGAYLTDTMILVHVDTKKKKATLVSLPRDMWVKLPAKSGDDIHMKINTVYEIELFPNDFPDVSPDHFGTKDDANFAKYIISQVTGLTIDGYVGIDFQAFQKAIDVIGGVDVDVEKSFTDEEYPIDGHEADLCGKTEKDLPDLLKIATDSPTLAFPCRYEKITFQRGLNHMNGEMALKYVRSRHSLQDGGDFGRAARQQRLIEAVRNKVLSVDFITKVPSLIDEMQKYIKTDIAGDLFKKFLGEITSAKDYTITRFVLSDANYLKNAFSAGGQFILIPDNGADKWKDVQIGIKNEIEGITPTPSPLATPSGTIKTK